MPPSLGNGLSGVVLSAVVSPTVTNVTIGGTAAWSPQRDLGQRRLRRRVVSGVAVQGNFVQGNYVGTNAAGTAALPNGQHGVYIHAAAAGNTVGGSAAARNVLSGNGGQGVRIDFLNTTNNVVAGNFIGTDAAGTAGIANGTGGVSITLNAANNTIGGVAADAGNLIAYNVGGDGISTGAAAGAGNAFLGNAIHSNGGLGIDLGNNGVTANDTGDGDAGPNNLQNFPVLSAAATDGVGNVHLAGSLNSAASTTYRVEFFASSAAGPDRVRRGSSATSASRASRRTRPGTPSSASPWPRPDRGRAGHGDRHRPVQQHVGVQRSDRRLRCR